MGHSVPHTTEQSRHHRAVVIAVALAALGLLALAWLLAAPAAGAIAIGGLVS